MSAPLCRVYWGSHGCSQPAGHGDLSHQCGPDDATDPDDGPCSRIDWDPEEQVWWWRFSTTEGGWGEDRYPTAAFGEGLPADLEVDPGHADQLRRRLQDEGRLAVFEDGRWVYRARTP